MSIVPLLTPSVPPAAPSFLSSLMYPPSDSAHASHLQAQPLTQHREGIHHPSTWWWEAGPGGGKLVGSWSSSQRNGKRAVGITSTVVGYQKAPHSLPPPPVGSHPLPAPTLAERQTRHWTETRILHGSCKWGHCLNSCLQTLFAPPQKRVPLGLKKQRCLRKFAVVASTPPLLLSF